MVVQDTEKSLWKNGKISCSQFSLEILMNHFLHFFARPPTSRLFFLFLFFIRGVGSAGALTAFTPDEYRGFVGDVEVRQGGVSGQRGAGNRTLKACWK